MSIFEYRGLKVGDFIIAPEIGTVVKIIAIQERHFVTGIILSTDDLGIDSHGYGRLSRYDDYACKWEKL